jgi:hypothetical protein
VYTYRNISCYLKGFNKSLRKCCFPYNYKSFILIKIYSLSCIKTESRGKSVRLVDWTIRVRSPTRPKGFYFSFCTQTGSGARSASYTLCTEVSFPGDKPWPVRDADHSPPSTAEVKNEEELYLLSSPQAPSRRVTEQLYFLNEE